MKQINEAMTLEDLEVILIQASKISNHRRFVIAGSLSAIGAVVVPPKTMVMSRDLDMYPQLDPERGFVEIASELGEGSEFHKEHGFYADPITPKLLALPTGWESRIAQISLQGGVVAMFLDPNDVAIGKLMRGNDNDLRWVHAGLQEGILSIPTMLERERTVSNSSTEEHEKVRRSLNQLLLAGEPGDDLDVVPKG